MKDYEVFLSPLAKFKLNKLLHYIEVNWGVNAKEKFLNKLENSVDQLSKFPQSYPASRIKKGIRKSVITPQISLFYRIHKKAIEIITVIDNRQDPKRTANEIEEYFLSDSRMEWQ